MNLAALQALVAAGESKTLELKKSTAEKDRSLCALSNNMHTIHSSFRRKPESRSRDNVTPICYGSNDASLRSISKPSGASMALDSGLRRNDAILRRVYAVDSLGKAYQDFLDSSLRQHGTLLDGLTVEQIKSGNYKSHLRNKQIATVFKELDLIEKYGSGVRRVIDAFVAYGLPEPEFAVTQGGMAVTVFKAPGQTTGVGVNVGVNGLLAYIQANPGKRTDVMAVTFTVTRRTIERWLKQLKDQQQIEFRGAPKSGGYYLINK